MEKINNIVIRGARQHNLKNVDIDIPKDKLVVITGVSGSGKSTLAFDTLYAEGQRRYVESLSSYARQFLELMDKPDVDLIEGLSPAISIEQKSISRNPRSTVGTITEIYDYMRLLFARVGDVYCPCCGKRIETFTVQNMVDDLLKLDEGSKLEILSPVIRGKKGEFKKYFKDLLKDGFVRAYFDKKLIRLEDEIVVDKKVKHDVSILVDRLVNKPENKRRITDSVEIALRKSEGLVEVIIDGSSAKLYNEKFACIDCGVSIAEVEPRIFSFNNPFGACPVCEGIGEKAVFDEDSIVVDSSLSIRDGAISLWVGVDNFHHYNMLNTLSEKYKINLEKSWSSLSKASKDIILYGVEEPLRLYTFRGDKKVFYEKKFKGAVGDLEEMLYSNSSTSVDKAKKCMTFQPCRACGGARLKKDSLSVKLADKNISEVTSMNIAEAEEFFKNLEFNGFKLEIATKIIREILRRLNFLINVGIDYITLNRSSGTLSGGESQRIRLATQIGSGLTGVLYVLDEPSIGLHQRDNDMLIATLKNLRDIGNSVIVVEHDEDTILASDYVIDMGPYAGRKGGEVVFAGTPKDLLKSKESLTAKYINGKLKIELPEKRVPVGDKFISIKGATEHNLKNIDADFPIGLITSVTGVSGSGKSTLVLDILYPAMMKRLHGSSMAIGKHKSIEGCDHIDKVIKIDQSPIGRTPRSNPATYTDLFKDIRDIFTMLPESKRRGYTAGRFSFNKKGGRCESCQGDGFIKIEMHFLPDMYVKCDVCNGNRYNRDTLDIVYKEKNIADVLFMTVNQAYEFFDNIPKLKAKLNVLRDVGLGYIKLGQAATTLSGGESQRVKLAKELMKRSTGKTLYLFDEPTTGLHFDDIHKLVNIFQELRDIGNTIVIIEHNLDVIKVADFIIDLGREGGVRGGEVLFTGTPEECAKCEDSFTGQYLSTKLN